MFENKKCAKNDKLYIFEKYLLRALKCRNAMTGNRSKYRFSLVKVK